MKYISRQQAFPWNKLKTFSAKYEIEWRILLRESLNWSKQIDWFIHYLICKKERFFKKYTSMKEDVGLQSYTRSGLPGQQNFHQYWQHCERIRLCTVDKQIFPSKYNIKVREHCVENIDNFVYFNSRQRQRVDCVEILPVKKAFFTTQAILESRCIDRKTKKLYNRDKTCAVAQTCKSFWKKIFTWKLRERCAEDWLCIR